MQRNPYISRFVERLAILCALQSVWLTVHAKLAQLKVEKIGRTGDLWSTDTSILYLKPPGDCILLTQFFGRGEESDLRVRLVCLGNFGENENTRDRAQ